MNQNPTQAAKQAPNKNRADVMYGVAILEITTLVAVQKHEIQTASKGDILAIYTIVPNYEERGAD